MRSQPRPGPARGASKAASGSKALLSFRSSLRNLCFYSSIYPISLLYLPALSIYPSLYLTRSRLPTPTYLPPIVYLSIYLPFRQSLNQSTNQPICLSIYLSIYQADRSFLFILSLYSPAIKSARPCASVVPVLFEHFYSPVTSTCVLSCTYSFLVFSCGAMEVITSCHAWLLYAPGMTVAPSPLAR